LFSQTLAPGFAYPNGDTVSTTYDDADLLQLAKLNLLTLARTGQGLLRGKPTQLAIQLIRNATTNDVTAPFDNDSSAPPIQSPALPSDAVALDPTPDVPRRQLVDTFLASCNAVSKTRIGRVHIWRLVGHRTARQFEYWQAENDRPSGETRGATEQEDQNFRRVLAMKPDAFLSALVQKSILQ
jgi:hypothetical protein